jgi:phage shock protein PspC (stress-responsive transcriptional regulator)
VCSLFGLVGIIAYCAAWIVMPEEPRLLPVAVNQGQEIPNRN